MQDDITNYSLIKAYTEKHDFHFKKKLGQNFLTDANTAKKIVGALELKSDETVLEIGPGAGALTQHLIDKAENVVAVEIDPFAVNILNDHFGKATNVQIITADILKTDINGLLAPYKGNTVKAISNLPYYITSPVIMKLLESKYPFCNIIVTMQKEVAKRISAKPGTKDYSVFSIIVDYYATVEYLFDIPSTVFVPQPQVDSAVIKITPRVTPYISVTNEEVFFATVKAGFLMRRKTLLNCLCSAFSLSRDKCESILKQAQILPGVRGETLDIADFARLSDIIAETL